MSRFWILWIYLMIIFYMVCAYGAWWNKFPIEIRMAIFFGALLLVSGIAIGVGIGSYMDWK